MTAKKLKKTKRKNSLIIAFSFILALIILFFLSSYIYYLNKIYPGVYIAGISVGGNTQVEALNKIKSSLNKDLNINISFNDKNFRIPANSLNINYDLPKTTKRAMGMGRSGNIIFDLQNILNSSLYKTNYGLEFSLDKKILENEITEMSKKITIAPINPKFELIGDKILVTKGKPGTQISNEDLESEIEMKISQLDEKPINITLKQKDFSDNNFIDRAINEISDVINKPAKSAVFTFANNKVQAFSPESNGLEVNVDKLKSEIESGSLSIEIPTSTIEAQIKTSDVNSLGIKELIGTGTSRFAGSIASRVFNINLAAQRINNALIAPGDTFSFDKTVGDISALNGYEQAYVIQNGQTVLGDGGGVCQVSTTMFRAAMNSGLPIVERHAHAYRVHYYEEDALPGLDATIYSPSVDFKFKNDTSNFILIQTQIDLRNLILTFNLYGTNDGRVVKLTKPTLWDYKPAPQDLYTDDPTLPVGQIKQIDFAASGIKSQFEYTVTKNGEVINHQTFFSDFTPWQAKYLRGTKT